MITKFRGKRKSGTEILIGDLNHIDGKVFIFPRTQDAPLNSPDWFEVEPVTVGQFTGMLDSRKKEVFSGDILVVTNYKFIGFGDSNSEEVDDKWEDLIGKVIFREGCFGILDEDKSEESLGFVPFIAFDFGKDVTVQ